MPLELRSEMEVLVPGEEREKNPTGRPPRGVVRQLDPTNPQTYENNPLHESEVVDVLAEMEGKLHNLRDPNLAIQHEKPEHRIVLLLKLKGYSNKEISEQTGFTIPWISQITRQPWFQTHLTAALSKAEGEVIDEIVKVEAVNSVYKLVQLRDTAKSESVQLASAVELINRHLGKPVNRTEVKGTYNHSVVAVDKINQELELIEEEEKKLIALGTAQG